MGETDAGGVWGGGWGGGPHGEARERRGGGGGGGRVRGGGGGRRRPRRPLWPRPGGGAEAPVQPYGTNDAGGFRNVLPAGENGLDNAAQLAEFQLNGTYPPHFKDQLPLYAGLIYASPTLTHEQIASYFKDATFGVKEGDVASTESPHART